MKIIVVISGLRDLLVFILLLSLVAILPLVFGILMLSSLPFLGIVLIASSIVLIWIVFGYVVKTRVRWREARFYASCIAGFKRNQILLSKELDLVPGYMILHTTTSYYRGQRYVTTRSLFMPIPWYSGYYGDKSVLDYSFSSKQGFFIAMNKSGEGYAVLPVYCTKSRDICIALISPDLEIGLEKQCVEDFIEGYGAKGYGRLCINWPYIHCVLGMEKTSKRIRGVYSELVVHTPNDVCVRMRLCRSDEGLSRECNKLLTPSEPVVVIFDPSNVNLYSIVDKLKMGRNIILGIPVESIEAYSLIGFDVKFGKNIEKKIDMREIGF